MAVKYLGGNIDIHTGGIDHIPVHHTNEIAQSQGAFGKDVVRFWLHNEFVLVDGAKMSKSKGNFYRPKDVAERGVSSAAVRYFFLQAHYRSPVNFTWEAVEAAQNGLQRLHEKIQNSKLIVAKRDPVHGKIQNYSSKLKIDENKYALMFQDAINDDLNTSKGLAVLWDMLKDDAVSDEEKFALAVEFDRVLGLGLADAAGRHVAPLPSQIKKLAKEREAARAACDFARSDELRRELEGAGYEVRDTKDGQEVVIARF